MFNLLYKELRLATHPNLYIFTLLGALVYCPAYPYGMVFIFGCLGPYISFMYGRETDRYILHFFVAGEKERYCKSKSLTYSF